MKPCRLINFFSRFNPHRNVPAVSHYSTTAESPPPSTLHRTQWKGTLHRLYARISNIPDPKGPIYPILDQWVEQGRPVDKTDLVYIIRELNHFKRFHTALQVSMWMTDKRYFEVSAFDAAVRLDLIAKVHGVELAEAYFDNIPVKLKSLRVYTALLNCYAHAKLVEKAEATMQEIRELGLAMTSLAYNKLLNLYCQTGNRDKFDVLTNEMEEKRIRYDKFTYGILLTRYAADSDIVAVEKILARWESRGDCRLDWISYAVVANLYVKAGNEDKALTMLNKCEELIPSSDRPREAYEHLMPQYAALGKKDDVLRLWELYKGQMRVYNKGYKVMITSLLKIGDTEGAQKIFEEWESQQTKYDVRIPNHLIAAYVRKGLVDEAEAIIESIILKGAKPDAKSWYFIAKVHLDLGHTEKAVEFSRKALSAMQPRWKTDKNVWAACLDYLIKKPDPEGAKDYIKQLGDNNAITLVTQERLLNKIYETDSNSLTAGDLECDGPDGDEEAGKVSEVEGTTSLYNKAGLQTRLGQWWEGLPFLTSAVVGVCATIYIVCLLAGYDSFDEVCFLPSAIVSRFQVYRIFTAILFHGSLLHVLFNMMALVPLGSELERIMGSVRLLYIIILLATTNALLHLLIALLVAYNPIHSFEYLMHECAIGFSGILFSMIVIETSLSGQQYRSVFGLFNVPAKWYAWILLVVFQLVMSNVSLLGHLCGILSGFAYSYGLFNFLIPGPSFYSKIEASSLLSSCVRRPKFILCTGGNPSAFIPTYSSQGTTSSGLFSGNLWRNLSSWIPQRETSSQATQDSHMFPGRGRTLGSGQGQAVSDVNSESNLQARLLDSDSEHPSDAGRRLSDGRQPVNNTVAAGAEIPVHHQDHVASEEEIQKHVSMGFERTQVEVALAAADGDINVAVEILSQQG